MNMTDCPQATKRFRRASILALLLAIPSFAIADPVAANDDLRTSNPVAANAALTIPGATLTGNDTLSDNAAIDSVTSPTADGATVSYSSGSNQVTYTPGNGTGNKFLALDSGETEEDSFTYTLEDDNNDTDSATVQIRVTGVNDAPTVGGLTGTANVNDNDNTNTPLSGITVGDPDVENVTITLTLDSAKGEFSNYTAQGFGRSTSSGNYIYTYTGSTANAQSKTRVLNFVPVENLAEVGNNTSLSIAVSVSDGDLSASGSKSVSIASINDTPVLSVPGSNVAMDDNESKKIFAGVSITDPDLNDSVNVVITYDNRDGDFPTSASYSKSGNNASAKITITAVTVAAANTTIQNLNYTPVPNQVEVGESEEHSFAFEVEDESNADDTGTVTVDVTSVNDPPVTLINDGAATLNAVAGGTVSPFSLVTVNDPDVEGTGSGESSTDTFTGTVVLANSTTASAIGSLISSNFTEGSTAGTYTYTATLTVLQNAIQGLSFLAPASGDHNVTLSLTVADSDGASSDALVVTVASTELNPGISGLETGQTVNDNSAIVPFANASIDDFGSSDRAIRILLDDDTKGFFDILGEFIYVVPTASDASPYYQMVGNGVDVVESLRGLRFNPTPNRITGASGSVTFTIQVFSSSAASGSPSSTDSLVLTVLPVNDAPRISSDSPTYRINDDETANPFQSLRVTDPDEGGNQIVTITVSLAGAAPNPQDAGTLALDGDNPDFGLDDFDGGIVLPSTEFTYDSTGADPTITIGDFVFTYDDSGKEITFSEFAVTRDDLSAIDFSSLVLSFDKDFNTTDGEALLSFTGAAGTAGAIDAFALELEKVEVFQFIGEPSAINEILEILVFTPTANRRADGERETVEFTLLVEDANGGAAQVSDVDVVVLSVNGAPVIIGVPDLSQQPFPIPGSVDETSGDTESSPFVGLSVTDDVDPDGSDTVTFLIELDDAAKGTISGGGFVETSAGSGIYSFTGNVTAVNAALPNVVYTLSESYPFSLSQPGLTEFTLTAIDSSPAANQSSEDYAIVVREPIVARVVTSSEDYSALDPAIDGSLRQAIETANSNDYILFDFAPEEYPVTIRLQRAIEIQKNLKVVGARPDQLIISGDSDADGEGDVPLFIVSDGANLSLEQLTLRDGLAASFGGAVAVDGTGSQLSARYVNFESNEAGQFGGAIDVNYGELLIEQCLFVDNRVTGSLAVAGGAVSVFTTGEAFIVNSSFYDNRQENSGGLGGGALYAENSDLMEEFYLLVEHCTFDANVDARLSGSAILSVDPGMVVRLRNNIFADEQGNVLDVEGEGIFESLGGNIATDTTATTYTLGNGSRQNVTILNDGTDGDGEDLTNVDPLLLPLGDNSGPTDTLALDDLSEAKGAALSPSTIADKLIIDQRGVWRETNFDVGAFQSGSFKRININEIQLTAGEQFIEFYNPRESEPLSLEGLELYVDGQLVHTFDATNDPIAAGAGFFLDQADFNEVDFVNNPIDLNAESGTVTIQNAAGQLLLSVDYVGNFEYISSLPARLEVAGQSIVRYPNFEGPFLPHRRVIEQVTGQEVITGGLESPGEDVSGAPLNGGNAPPIASPDDEEGYALLANETAVFDVIANDIEFDRTDTLKIVEIMDVTNSVVENLEIAGLNGGDGSYTLPGTLSPDTTVDATDVSVTATTDLDAIHYDPTASDTMIALSKGEQTVDIWAYTILDYDESDDPLDRDPNTPGTDPKRIENIKKATTYFYVTVTGVNEAPEANDDGAFSTTETQAIRLMADADLLAGSFDFGDLEADYKDFDATGIEQTYLPVLQTTALLSNDDDVDNDDSNGTIKLINVHTDSTRVEQTTTTSALGATVTLDIRASRSETNIIYDPRSSAMLNALSATDSPVEDSFYYTVIDRHGAIDTAKVTILVSGVNDVPTANDDRDFFTQEDETLEIEDTELLGNDTDPDQDGTDVVDAPAISSVPAQTTLGATLSFDGTTITYDPVTVPFFEVLARNEVVIDQFTYQIDDGNSGTSEATVFVELVGRNDRPTAEDDTLQVDENELAQVEAEGLLGNDEEIDVNGTDPDDDFWVIPQREVTTPLGAALNIETDGSYSYDANSPLIESLYEGEVVNETFLYTITDNSRTSAGDDNYKITAGRTDVVLPVLSNDIVAGAPRSPIAGYADASGELLIESENHALREGTLIQIESYDGAGDYNGVHAITVVDRDHFSIDATFVDDPDGLRGTWRPWFSITATSTPNRNGQVEIAEDGQSLIYSPRANFAGTETFKYTIKDGAGGQDVALVEMRVIQQPLNSFLVAKDDRFDIYNEQGAQVVDILANDNVLPEVGSALTILDVQPLSGATGDVEIVNSGQSLSYEPSGLGTEAFTYTVSGGGSSTTTATVTFDVLAPEVFVADSDAAETTAGGFFADAGENFTVVENSIDNFFDVLANDSTLPNSPVSLQLLSVETDPTNGTATLDSGQIRFTPDTDYTGSDSFEYRVRDELGNEQVKVVNVEVVADLDEFYAVEDHYVVWAGSSLVSLPVLANDLATGANADSLLITNFGLDTQAPPEQARVAFNANEVLYTAPESATVETFTYEVADGSGSDERREAYIVITVLDTFPALAPHDDTFSVAKNSAGHSFDVLANDTVFPLVGWDRTLSSVTTPDSGGSASVVGGATLSYSPAADFIGVESFTYTVEDVFGQSETATVSVMVGMLITGDDAYTVLENSSDNPLTVLINDDLLDRYAEEYVIAAVGTPDNGGLVSIDGSDPNNQLLYSPAADFVGEERFTYSVEDMSGNQVDGLVTVSVIAEESDRDTALLQVTLTGVNDIPVFTGVADSQITDKETNNPFANVLITDVDEGGSQAQTVTISFDPTLGELTTSDFTETSPGEFTFTGTPAQVTAALRAIIFTPTENLVGSVDPGSFDVVFDLTLTDGYLASPIERSATVNVISINDAPDPVDDSYATEENQAIRLLADPGLLSVAFDFGDLAPDFQDFDANGNQVTLLPILKSPNLLVNDDDVDSDDDNTTIELINVHTTDTRVNQLVATSALGASVILDIRAVRNETNILYDPRGSAILNALSAGETIVDTFYYTVRDQHGAYGQAEVSITVTGVNDVPTANGEGGFELTEDGTIVISGADILSNDTDPDQDGNGSDDAPIISNVPPFSDLGAALSFDGTDVTYDPADMEQYESLARNEFLPDSFTYTISDQNGGTSQAVIEFLIEGINDAPVADDDALAIDENDTQTRDRATGLISNDSDIDMGINFNGGDPNDDPWILPQRQQTSPLGAAFTIETDGSYSYDANSRAIDSLYEGEIAVETFPYVIIDNSRLSAADDRFKVIAGSTEVVLPILSNDDVAGSVPVAIEGFSEDIGDAQRVIIESFEHPLREGMLVKIQGYDGDGDYNGVYPISVIDRDHFSVAVPFVDGADTTLGTWRPWFEVTAVSEADQEAVLEISEDGQSILYTPEVAFYGSEQFEYTIMDGVGGQDVALVELTVLQAPLNTVLSASDDRFQIGKGESSVEVDVLVNDNVLPALGSDFSITAVSAGSAGGTLLINSSNDAVIYSPIDTDFTGVESFTYDVSGGGSSSAQATVTFEVIDREGYLRSAPDAFFVIEDSTGNLLDVAANDTTLPSFPVSFEVVAVSTPTSGVASVSGGQVSYTPNASFIGTDTFTYTIRDLSGSNVTETVTVEVVPNVDDFYARNDTYIVVAGSGDYNFDVLINDGVSGAAANDLIIEDLGLDDQAPEFIERVGHTDSVVTYTAPEFATTEDFTYEILNGIGTDPRREALITIIVVDSLPTPTYPLDDAYHVAKNSAPHSLDVLINDIPLPAAGWSWTITSVGAPTQGGVAVNDGGTAITYTPAAGFYGVETFSYTIEDVFGDSASATVTVTVGSQLTEQDVYTVLENSTDNDFPVLVNDDILGRFPADYTISQVGTPDQGGSVSIDGSGPDNQLLYTPAADFVGEESFTYTVIDNTGAEVTETVTVLVIDENGDRDFADFVVTLTGINDITEIANAPDGSTTDKLSVKPFPSITITDLDEWDLQDQITVLTFDATLGSISAPAFTQTGPGTYTMTGTPAEVQAALRAIVFTPYENVIDYIEWANDNSVGDLDFTLSLDDLNLGPVLGDSADAPVVDVVTVNIEPIDDAPTVVSPIPDLVVQVNSAPRARQLAPHFADVDDEIADDELAWTVSGNTNPALFNSVTVDAAKQLVVFDFATNAPGVSEITIRGTDRGLLFVETTMTVTVEGPPVINLQAGETQPPAATYTTFNSNGYIYRQSFRVTNEGTLPASAFIVCVSGLDELLEVTQQSRVRVIRGEYSSNENGTTNNFSDDSRASDGVTLEEISTDEVDIKYDKPLESGESIVVHVFYQTISLGVSGGIRPDIEIKLTTATPTVGDGVVIEPVLDGGEGEMKITFPVEAGRTYQVQYTSNLSDPSGWTDWGDPITIGTFGQAIVVYDDGLNTDPHPSLVSERFYRVIEIVGP